jgi:hypothetical protein
MHAMDWLRSTGAWRFAALQVTQLSGVASRLLGKSRQNPSQLLGDELQALASDLRAVCDKLERDFLTTSEELEKLAGHGTSLFHASEMLVGSATGRTGGSALLSKAMQVVEEPLNFLDDSHPKTQVILKRLRQDSSRIDELINVQVELQQTIGPLKYIQTLFKIESAPLGGEVQAMFGALTREIETLHDQICELFTTRFLELRAIQQTVNQVISQLQAQTEGLWESVTREKTKIEKSLQAMQGELIQNQYREANADRLGKQVNQDIQEVVMGLQYQDIINQKLQHVLVSLNRLEDHLDSEASLVDLGGSCRLEAGQLQAIRAELKAAEMKIKDGITRMLDRIISASTGCLMLEEYSQLTISADGMVQILFDTFASLREQVAITVTGSAKAFDQLRSVGGLASDLTVVVRDHSQRIHLIGLNAQLQAAQVGQRVGLEVLSARTSEISRATNQISEAVARKLDQLVLDLADDVRALETLNADGLRQQSKLQQEGASTEHALHEMRDTALAMLTQVNTLLEDIRAESNQTLENVRHVATADAAISALESKLLELAQTAAASGMNADRNSNTLVEAARRGYTMTSQHQVFKKVLAGQGSTEANLENGSVELFDTPETNPKANAVTIQASILPTGANSQSALKGPPSPTVPNKSSPAGPGENIELFE